MNFLLMPVGSAGDVFPLLAVGHRLRDRGHAVAIATNGHFAGLIEQAGFRFIEVGTAEDYDRIANDPRLWHPSKGTKLVFERAASPLMQRAYDVIAAEASAGPLVVAASSLAFGARVAQDRLGVPTATMHLQPAVFRSLYDPPDLGTALLAPWLPRWLRRITLYLGDRLMVDRMICPALNDLRREVGLAPVKRVFKRWWHSPQLVIGTWPRWYAAPQPDWPGQTRLVGFVMYDAADQRPMPAELSAFLDECERDEDPPIVFTAGSEMRHSRAFLESAAGACERLGRRGVLICRQADQAPSPLPDGVRRFAYAPFGQLFRRAAAVVHHGGMGTTAQAMRAGRPQLVVPFSHDQPDNARRVRRLGLGDRIGPGRFTVSRAGGLLGRLLASKRVRAACRETARRFDGVDAAGDACDLLEGLAGQGGGA